MQIPARGRDKAEILSDLQAFHDSDIAWKTGRIWSMMYSVDEEHKTLVEEAYRSFLTENYISPFTFASLQRMEQEVIAMSKNLLNGPESVCGTMTSGGTESIFLCVYTYREWARKNRPQVQHPELVMSSTTHPAFEKAAHILNIKIRRAKVDENQAAQPAEMAKLVNKNTILIVASAPSYPHGILDPVQEIAVLAQKHQLPLHVDACVGGFMLPWVEKLGYSMPAWDFRVPGVTSMSADAHKFGYGAKGASVLLFSKMDYLRHQFFVSTEWAGGVYASSTLMGSRSGGPIAAAWTAMQHLGQNRYLDLAREIMEGVDRLKMGLEGIPEVQIIGHPAMNILAYCTHRNKPDIFVVADLLIEKGWVLDRQHLPNSIHLTVMRHNLPVIGQYLSDLKEAIATAKANPNLVAQGEAAMYGILSRLPMRGMVEKNVRKIFEDLYTAKTGTAEGTEAAESPGTMPNTPAWMGMLNRILRWKERWF